MTQNAKEVQADFYSMGIAPGILEALNKMKIKIPTPIQTKAIPPAIEGKDIIGVAQTGTGKTLAFAVPIIQRLAQRKGRCLILVPTRELAVQVHETFRAVLQQSDIRTVVLIGGASMNDQIRIIRKNPRIIIATPGRLDDHLNRRTINLSDVCMVVLDEADRMLDMGFKDQIETMLKRLPSEKQVMLFSATIPEEIMKIAATHMKLPVSIEIALSGTVASKVSQELFIVKREAKKMLLEKMLEKYRGVVLIFSRTKIGATKITRMVKEMGHSVAEIHSDRTQGQRKQALEGFKSGRYRILVATDIAARGIDVSGIELVINYDIPEDAENYVHRIGRTGRAGHEGHAVSFATPEQGDEVRKIERITRATLPIGAHPEVPAENFTSYEPRRQSFGKRRGFGGSSRPGGFSRGSGRNAGFGGQRSSGPGKSFSAPRSAYGSDAPRPAGGSFQRNTYGSGYGRPQASAGGSAEARGFHKYKRYDAPSGNTTSSGGDKRWYEKFKRKPAGSGEFKKRPETA